MTEFKRTAEELQRIEELLRTLQHDVATPSPAKLQQVQTIKKKMDGELAAKTAMFERRLMEKDPETGVPRYGLNMRAKVIDLLAKFKAVGEAVPSLEAQLEGDTIVHRMKEAVSTEEARKAERERRLEEETRIRGELERQEQQRCEEEAAAGILEREQLRLAEEARKSREQRRADAEEEERRRDEDKARKEREAGELTSSVPVGAAGVEEGLRRIEEACDRGSVTENKAQKREAVKALEQILCNVVSNPEEPRFRRIRRDNEPFQQAVGRFEGGIQILVALGFRVQVEEGRTVLVMHEPDLSEDMDGWSTWYQNITAAAARLRIELDERF